MPVLRVGPLPDAAGAAAARFYAEFVPMLAAGDLILIFAPADHTHRAWRLAAVQAMARQFAPARVNALAGGSEAAIAAACSFLECAEGVTGQLLELDDTGAGEVVTTAA